MNKNKEIKQDYINNFKNRIQVNTITVIGEE